MLINIAANDKVTLTKFLQLFWATEFTLLIIALQRLYLGSWEQTLTIITAQIFIVFVYYFAHKGHQVLASNTLILMITTLLLIFIWGHNGLRDEALLVLPAIIMYSLLLGNKKLAIYIYLFICLNIILIAYLNHHKVIHHVAATSTLSSAVLIIIILTLMTYAILLLANEINQTSLALKKSRNELEIRVSERTHELETSLKELTKTQKQLIEAEKIASLGRLVAGVAHEINTPLGIAITASSSLDNITESFNQALQEDHITKKSVLKYNSAILQSTQLISSNLNRAEQLIQYFKEVAIDHSGLNFRNFNLKDYLQEVLTNLTPKVKNSQYRVELLCDAHIELFNHPTAIAQIITNLYINAIQHGFMEREQGLISIIVNQKNNFVTLLFKDSGVGMNAEVVKHIFEPFYTTKRSQGNCGLGMHITYNLVSQSLKGTINCASEVNEGTQFELRFPSTHTLC